MTITTTQSRVTYSGNGSTTVFAVPFYFVNNTDLVVSKKSSGGAVSTLTLNVDYTLSGAGVSSGGTLTKTTALLAGETLGIVLDPPITQTSHFVQNQEFPSATVEQGYDKLTQIAQRIRDIVSRGMWAPDADVNPSLQLPAASVRANSYPAFDASGNLVMATVLPSGTLSRASIGSYLYPQTSAEATAGVTPSDLSYPELNVLRYGADPTGVADSYTAITNALTVAAQVGSMVYLPRGKYITTQPIRIRESTGLRGDAFMGGAYSGTVQSSAIWAAPSFNYPTRGIIESYNVSGGGLQEFAPVQNLAVFGNMANGAICGAGILWAAIFVNSVIRDVQIQECSGDGIKLDGTLGGGPVEIQNVWINNCNGNSLNIDGPFQYVRVRDVAFERWGKSATSGTKYAIRAVNSSGGDLLRYLMVDGFYSELQPGKNHDCIFLQNASYVVLRNVSAGGGSSTESGAFIRITQTGGSASYAYPRGSNVLGVICEQVYVGTGTTSYSAGTIVDSVNSVTRTDGWIPRYATPEPMVTIGSSGAPAFKNSWANTGGGFQSAGYLIDENGWVCLFGSVSSGTVGSAAFTLPAGARPVTGLRFPVISNAAVGLVQVTSAGDVTPSTPSSNVYVSLDGIRFKALA